VPGDFDLVKERVDIVQLVQESGTALRRSGRTYVGLCPFHAEKTPSFHVDPERRTFKCFGCSEGGDVFDWVMKRENVDKADALRQLAERAGVQLSTRPRQESERAKRLVAAHETALFYFRQALRSAHGAAAAEYLAKRGLASTTIDRFGLGYAPDIRDGLLVYLRRKGFSEEEAVASGLVVQTENGLFDRFRARLMVPTRDAKGQVIAFGGRAMRADQTAKYINSPQTILFNKSATLYALDVARPAIRRLGEAVIVEGYFDAIACHQAGLDNVVASQGTALTEAQYRVLDALKIDRAVVAFDADAAGTASAEKRGRELVAIVRRARTGAVSTRTGLGVYVAQLPSGDPDELARSDPDRLRRILGEAKPVLEYVIDRVLARHELSGPDGRRRFLAEVLPLLAEEPDALTRELYFGALAARSGVPQEALRAEAERLPRAPAGRRGEPPPASAGPEPVHPEQTTPLERFVMAQLVQFPEEAARVDLTPDDLSIPEHRAILEHLRGTRPTADFPAHLAATVAALGASGAEPASEADAGRELEIAALRLKEQNLRRRLGEARGKLARATGGDVGALDDEVARLAEDLDAVMKRRQQSTVLHVEMESE
jgi:DNA primase